MITRNPWRSDVAQVVLTGEDGHETFFLVEEVRKNEFGFAEGAAVFGESYKALPETPAQMAAKKPKRWSPVQTTPQMQPPHARRRRCRSAGGLTRINISTTPHFRPICRSVVRPLTYAGRALNNVP